jgi:hypothetical protein
MTAEQREAERRKHDALTPRRPLDRETPNYVEQAIQTTLNQVRRRLKTARDLGASCDYVSHKKGHDADIAELEAEEAQLASFLDYTRPR